MVVTPASYYVGPVSQSLERETGQPEFVVVFLSQFKQKPVDCLKLGHGGFFPNQFQCELLTASLNKQIYGISGFHGNKSENCDQGC
jgi:hypothetical protein